MDHSIAIAGLFVILGFLLFGTILFLLIFFGLRKARKQTAFMKEMASYLDLNFIGSAARDTVNGPFFSLAGSSFPMNILSGKFQDVSLKLYNYSIAVGDDEHAHLYRYTICELDFSCELPYFSLFSLENKPEFSNDLLDSLPHPLLPKSVSVQLEGDFNRYFQLNTEKGFEIEIFEIFTQDVMSLLLAQARKVSIESFDTRLYIYFPRILDTEESLKEFYLNATALVPALSSKLFRMSGSVRAMKELGTSPVR